MSQGHRFEDLIRLPDHYEPALAPDRERVAFFSDATGRIELYVQRLGGERRQVSDGNVPRNARPLAWSRDGERIYLHADEAGDEQHDVHAMDLEGNRERLVAHDGQCTIQDVGPHGRYLYFTSTAAEPKNLLRHDLRADETEQLTNHDQQIRTGLVSPDGDRVAYTTNDTEDYGNQDVYVARADGSDARKPSFSEVGAETTLADWADAGLLVYDDTDDVSRVGLYDPAADDVTWYGPGEHDEYAGCVTPDGDVLAVRARECAWHLVRYADPDGDGEVFDLPEGKHHVPWSRGRSPVVTADGRVLTVCNTADRRKELVACDPDTGSNEPVVAADYGDFDPDGFASAEYVTYDSHDGMEIGGLLYRADEADDPSPALVWAHGGPRGQVLREFYPLVQSLVGAGHSVFAPNFRGSTGRGREFRQLVYNDWGGDEQGDIAEAGRWLQRKAWVDEDRVAVYGRSFGGYSTYCQLTMYPKLWATGVAIVGISDLRVLYEDAMPHYRREYEQYLGDPEEDADFYRERSPVTHVDDMQRPICIVHGVNDPICPVTQARVFRDALEERGWTAGEEFEYHELGAEGHVSTDTEQRIRRAEILLDYVERRV
jgi:dipeptidyl aminopeptidase/acylaminoacyl peptidase